MSAFETIDEDYQWDSTISDIEYHFNKSIKEMVTEWKQQQNTTSDKKEENVSAETNFSTWKKWVGKKVFMRIGFIF
jgi:hypothetical protein